MYIIIGETLIKLLKLRQFLLSRRIARRIDALNHSHLSALSGGLLLLCGGDWEPFLGSPPLLAARPGGTTVARLCWPRRLSPQPSDGSAPAGVLAETNKALHTVRVAFRIGSAVALRGRRVHAGRSRQQRTTLAPYFAPPPMHSSPLRLFASPYFALDFAGILSVNGKRQSARRGWYVWTNG